MNLWEAVLATESGKGDPYRTLFGHSQREGGRFGGVDITQMPAGQLFNEFASPSGEYGSWVSGQVGHVATPMGAFQIVGQTGRDLIEKGVIDPSQPFDRAQQNRAGAYLAKQAAAGGRTGMRNMWEGFRSLSDRDLDSVISSINSGEMGLQDHSASKLRDFANSRGDEEKALRSIFTGEAYEPQKLQPPPQPLQSTLSTSNHPTVGQPQDLSAMAADPTAAMFTPHLAQDQAPSLAAQAADPTAQMYADAMPELLRSDSVASMTGGMQPPQQTRGITPVDLSARPPDLDYGVTGYMGDPNDPAFQPGPLPTITGPDWKLPPPIPGSGPQPAQAAQPAPANDQQQPQQPQQEATPSLLSFAGGQDMGELPPNATNPDVGELGLVSFEEQDPYDMGGVLPDLFNSENTALQEEAQVAGDTIVADAASAGDAAAQSLLDEEKDAEEVKAKKAKRRQDIGRLIYSMSVGYGEWAAGGVPNLAKASAQYDEALGLTAPEGMTPYEKAKMSLDERKFEHETRGDTQAQAVKGLTSMGMAAIAQGDDPQMVLAAAAEAGVPPAELKSMQDFAEGFATNPDKFETALTAVKKDPLYANMTEAQQVEQAVKISTASQPGAFQTAFNAVKADPKYAHLSEADQVGIAQQLAASPGTVVNVGDKVNNTNMGHADAAFQAAMAAVDRTPMQQERINNLKETNLAIAESGAQTGPGSQFLATAQGWAETLGADQDGILKVIAEQFNLSPEAAREMRNLDIDQKYFAYQIAAQLAKGQGTITDGERAELAAIVTNTNQTTAQRAETLVRMETLNLLDQAYFDYMNDPETGLKEDGSNYREFSVRARKELKGMLPQITQARKKSEMFNMAQKVLEEGGEEALKRFDPSGEYAEFNPLEDAMMPMSAKQFKTVKKMLPAFLNTDPDSPSFQQNVVGYIEEGPDGPRYVVEPVTW